MKTIETERLILRPITEDDTEAIFEYCQSENVGPNAGWKPHESVDETRGIMKLVFMDKENVFGVELKETGQLLGSIGLVVDPKDRTVKHECWDMPLEKITGTKAMQLRQYKLLYVLA